jgi:DNA-binding MarR family transcriptional regulator
MGLFARLIAEGEKMAQDFGVPTLVFKALHMIDSPLAMKELGSRMRCDPSFITSIADTLERHGLAVRESDPGDRRVKRLVLTPAGVDLRERMEQQMAARMPWRAALSTAERTGLLDLLHKITAPISVSGGPCPSEEVNEFMASAAVPPLARTPRTQRRESLPGEKAAR